MHYIQRDIDTIIRHTLQRNKSILLLGPRQTGKTTLLDTIKGDLTLSFIRPDVRLRYEKNPALLIGEIEAIKDQTKKGCPVILLDEIQKVPQILDIAQDLIDRHQAQFVLTGSSAHKLKRGTDTNLLPGRVVSLTMDPLTYQEEADQDLQSKLLYGSLPGIITVADINDKELDLESYTTSYLEEEIRAEAIVRNLGTFSRFLELAASESGKIINMTSLSKQLGIAHSTIKSYFQILEDCLIIERIEPYSKSATRKKLTKSPLFLFFDLGVRRLAAREGPSLPQDILGRLFEQYIGLELVRYSRNKSPRITIRFWRDPDGPEVDWVIDCDNRLIPVEVKYNDSPSKKDIRHLKTFLKEYDTADKAYLVCQTPRRIKLDDRIYAIPWQELQTIMP